MTSALLLALAFQAADASSHREAPAIAMDPAADISDFYSFLNPNDPSKIVFIMNVSPGSLPGAGPNFYNFDDDVLYAFNIDNDGDGTADLQLGMKTITTIQNGQSFLYNFGDISQRSNINLQQNYLAARLEAGVVTEPYVRFNMPPAVAPANVGTVSDPSMGYMPESTAGGSITADHIHTQGDVRVYVGPRQDPFYVDLERTFDLLNLGSPLYPALPTANQNTLLGYNVLTFAIELPVADVTWNGMPPTAPEYDAVTGELLNPMEANDVIASWASTSRPRNTTRSSSMPDASSGPFVQVARLGSPLVNEVVIPLGQKDNFNRSPPNMDGQFLEYILYPELPGLMDAILGTSCPTDFDAGLGLNQFSTMPGVIGREDLVLAFLTGIPGLTMPPDYLIGGPIPSDPSKVYDAFEALRMNLLVPSGFPNGRLPQDDVVDVALSAMCGLLIDGVTIVPDGVDSTGLTYLGDFPFLGDPWTGDDHPNGSHTLP